MKHAWLARMLARLASAALAGALSLGVVAAPTSASTLRLVPHADLKTLDPSFNTAYVTRNFGYMVYDTLFGEDSKGQPKPQMVDRYTVSKDGKQWTFTLRPGLKFSDGNPVTAKDCVASLERWSKRDGMGRVMLDAGAQWTAVDANTFKLTLKQPFGLVLEALAKPSGYPAFIFPERLARTDPAVQISEVDGSGPYLFKRDEWVPGNKVVFVRNPAYVPRKEPASGLAGGKKASIDRIEWVYLPDANTATAALKNGEVDMLEQVAPDYIAPLRADPNVKVGASGAYQGFVVFNQLQPPFNNVKARQAVLHAIQQASYMAAIGSPPDLRMAYCPALFICGGPNETAVGAAPYRKPDYALGKQLLQQAGYKGEKVVVLVPSDVPTLNAAALVTVQALRKLGMNVDAQSMDWASIAARRAKKDAPDKGGWNVYVTVAGELDADTPLTNPYIAAACGNSLPGWPCDKTLDALRTAWTRETDTGKRRQLLEDIQKRAYEVVPYASFGQFSPAYAARKNLKHTELLWRGVTNLWVLEK